jgi:hypothetical protein
MFMELAKRDNVVKFFESDRRQIDNKELWAEIERRQSKTEDRRATLRPTSSLRIIGTLFALFGFAILFLFSR